MIFMIVVMTCQYADPVLRKYKWKAELKSEDGTMTKDQTLINTTIDTTVRPSLLGTSAS
jgi:hypothetical protein